MFGLLNLYKPCGISSYDAVRAVRTCVGRHESVGHAGTLDPLAEGVLVLCLGPATRLVDYLQTFPKEYVTVGRLGAVSTTDDAEGQVTPTPSAAPPAEGALREALGQFVGAIRQVPPAYSAVKVQGRRAYDLARAGKAAELSARTVEVYRADLERYDWPELTLRIACGSGTYVRSLVRDLGAALGVGAYCLKIVRTAVGPLTAADAAGVADLTAQRVRELLIAPARIIAQADRVAVSARQAADLALGRAIDAEALTPAQRARPLLGAIDPAGQLVALVAPHPHHDVLAPRKVFRGR